MARLHEFINEHLEDILVEWEKFARTLPAADAMDVAALRDHAKAMLHVIARDLQTHQTAAEQTAKSEGESDAAESGAPDTAAQEHGADRAVSGFTMPQMLSELRALRATVLRLWSKAHPEVVDTDLEDMTRFNEAIDQAIAESVTQYGEQIGESKDRFLTILGHDLRNPLGAIIMSSAFMNERGDLKEPDRTLVARIESSARRMNQMVSDLLDFTRTSFGDRIPIARAPMDLGKLVRDVVAEVALRYPASTLKVEASGELLGEWDFARLTQALTNLVGNAVQHGHKNSPIAVAARGRPDEVVMSVHNEGPVIPAADLPRIFQVGGKSGSKTKNVDEHLGLGLYIVEQIVTAHGGTMEVQSGKQKGTTFSVHLPRANAP